MFNSLLNSSLAGIISQFQSIWSVAFRSSTLRHDTVAIFLVLFFVLPVVPFGGGGWGTPRMIHKWKPWFLHQSGRFAPWLGSHLEYGQFSQKPTEGLRIAHFFSAVCKRWAFLPFFFLPVWIKTFTLFPQNTFSSMPLMLSPIATLDVWQDLGDDFKKATTSADIRWRKFTVFQSETWTGDTEFSSRQWWHEWTTPTY